MQGSRSYHSCAFLVATVYPLKQKRRNWCQFENLSARTEVLFPYLGQHVARVSILAAPNKAKVVAAKEYPLGHSTPGENVVAEVSQPDG